MSAAPLSLDSTIRLRRGNEIPIFGLGTWLSEAGGECKEAVSTALDYGYRLIDTATMYKNHKDVGEALRAKGKRESTYLVSKLSNDAHGYDEALAELDMTLEELGVESLDLWLMHSPSAGKVVETWKAMLAARDSGKVKAVGVSNFGVKQLEALKAAGFEQPEVNQFELHCWNQQRELCAHCIAEGIAVMSFCPLARCKLFGQTALTQIATATGLSEAALAIRWLLQKQYVTSAPTLSVEHIEHVLVPGCS